MGKPSKAVLEFMEQYQVASDEIWEVHGSTWVVKHKALERIAAEQGIVFEEPKYLPDSDVKQGFVTILVAAKLGDRREWSFGEAGPKNNKNSYPVAMAEKRGKDRCILKLLSSHGALYSEAEADEFVQPRQNPHVTRAEDIHEEFTNDIPDAQVSKIKVKDARPLYEAMVKEMCRITDPAELREWGEAKALEINSMPGEWPKHFRGEYAKHQKLIMNGQAA